MIAIDTNVLLKYLLQDDEAQAKRASAVILGNQPVLITDVVFVEMIWTLKGKRYRLSKEAIINTINRLFEEPNLVFEDKQTIWCSLVDFRNIKPLSQEVNGKKQISLTH